MIIITFISLFFLCYRILPPMCLVFVKLRLNFIPMDFYYLKQIITFVVEHEVSMPEMSINQ